MSSLLLLFRRLFGLDGASRVDAGIRALQGAEKAIQTGIQALKKEVQANNAELSRREAAMQRFRSAHNARNALLNAYAQMAREVIRGLQGREVVN